MFSSIICFSLLLYSCISCPFFCQYCIPLVTLNSLWWPSNLCRTETKLHFFFFSCRILENAFILSLWPILYGDKTAFQMQLKNINFPIYISQFLFWYSGFSPIRIHDIGRDGQILLSISIIFHQRNHSMIVWSFDIK